MPFMNRGFFRNERAATVVFGTLLIILVTITVVSALAFFASVTAKNNMDRQSSLEEQKNENLKIVTIEPKASNNSSYSSYWDSLNFTVLNLDILDSRISALNINDDFIINYFLLDENGNLELDENENPKIFNSSSKITVDSEESVRIHVGSVPIFGTVLYNGSFTPINNSPGEAYPKIDSSGWLYVYDSNNARIGDSEFTVKDNQLNLSNVNISIPAGTYNVTYTTFLNGILNPNGGNKDNYKTTRSINVEIISDRINLFTKRFMPPTPVADVQSKSDISGNYLVLDASQSNDLDGFITDYQWDIYPNDNATPLSLPVETKHGNTVQVRPPNNSNVLIDLKVTNNYGMVSRLSESSGYIPIP